MTNQTTNTTPTLSPTMKLLLAVPYFLGWLLYFLATQNERQEYLMGKSRGFDCVGSESRTLTHTTWIYNTSKQPTRRYLTWREFWTMRGYYSTPEGIEPNSNNS